MVREWQVGQWVQVGRTDDKPDWWLIKQLPKPKEQSCQMYCPLKGEVRTISISQITSISGIITLPE